MIPAEILTIKNMNYKCMVLIDDPKHDDVNENIGTELYLPRIPVKGDIIELNHSYPMEPDDTVANFVVVQVTLFPSTHPTVQKGINAFVIVKLDRMEEQEDNSLSSDISEVSEA